ncbi:MAG: NAD(P)H-hydrate dehydratase [Chloroflexota bacterium]
MKVSTVAQMRLLDQIASEKFGIAPEILMENAGLAIFSLLDQKIKVKGKRFVVFCGSGNNGGDGLVIARKIHSTGGKVKVFLLSDANKYKDASQTAFDMLSKMAVPIQTLNFAQEASLDVAHCDAIIDGIFGTGLTREVIGIQQDVIELINHSGKTVFSIDIPSGIDGDTGRIMGVAVKADFTVSFGLPKIGNLLYPGYAHCGKLFVSHISFPPEMLNTADLKISLNESISLPPRDPAGHKGSFGETLFIAGAAAYMGAPYFASMAFLKSGGGYARLAAPQSITPFIAVKGSEIVFIPQIETKNGSTALKNKAALLNLIPSMDMVVMGPGLSLDPETQQLVNTLIPEINKPLLIDGDGITALSRDVSILKNRQSPSILTPHLGEMARLIGTSVKEIDEHKIEILQRTARELNAFIVLKGAHSLTACPDGNITINMSGNSGMATAGCGDVLTGTIAAMICLGLPIDQAIPKGVFLHGLAGDLAADTKGEDGITAQDILDHLPLAIQADRKQDTNWFQNRYEMRTVL